MRGKVWGNDLMIFKGDKAFYLKMLNLLFLNFFSKILLELCLEWGYLLYLDQKNTMLCDGPSHSANQLINFTTFAVRLHI